MEKRIVMHVDMNAFFAQIEENNSPHFRGKPIVVGADPKEGRGRGVVSTANYEARKYGIHSAMPISEAFKLCPQAIFLPVDFELYSHVSENIMEIIRKSAPLVEQVSLDEAYVDVSFLKDYAKAKELAERTRREILEKEHIASTCGVGPNKMIAKIACEKAKPPGPGILVVLPENVDSFLNPLEIEDIPGIGPKTAEKLKSVLKKENAKVSDAKNLSKQNLQDLFGKNGIDLYEKFKGRDESLVEEEEAKSLGKEHTFEKDTRDPEEITSVFSGLVGEVSSVLKEQHLAFKTVIVVCRFQGFETHTKSLTLKKRSRDVKVIKKEAIKLLLRFVLGNFRPIRLIGLRVNIEGCEQKEDMI